MSRPELYISIDIETDGPAPGVNNMLSLGAVALAPDGPGWVELDTWYKKFLGMPRAWPNFQTEQWWREHPEAFEEVMKDREQPDEAIAHFIAWLEDNYGKYKLIAVAWPAAFDFAFVNYYCHAYVGRNPLGFAALDIRSYINGLQRHPAYYGLGKAETAQLIGTVDDTGLRQHVALDDAIRQGRLFMAARRYVIQTDQMTEAVQEFERRAKEGHDG